jgi:hypothetical protein
MSHGQGLLALMQGVTYPLPENPAKAKFWPFGGPLEKSCARMARKMGCARQQETVAASRLQNATTRYRLECASALTRVLAD